MITDPGIDQYILNLIPPRDEVLAEMEAYAAEHRVPIIGPAVAALLAQLVHISGAKRIFELGSAIGYSTIWLARAAGAGAEVHYSDGDPASADRARDYFRRAGVADRIQVHVSDALQALASVPGSFDLIFNDVDKEGYPAVLKVAPGRLKKGGLFITDNTLWHGKVLNPQDEETRAVVEFDSQIFQDKRLISSIVPLRDGVVIAWKREN
ncbi:MAG: O-methyltransferase [Acidimicrobiia bacterium]|nr:O-methyltransferase [Acidimicrobiia bacterium]